MTKLFILSESEKKDILAKYYGDNIINEEQKSVTDKVYGMIKNLPLVRKIEKSYDSDIKKHVKNLISMVPRLKDKEQEIISLAKDGTKSSDELATKLSPEISNISKSGLNEQPITNAQYMNSYLSNTALPTKSSTVPPLWQIAVPTLIFLILFVRRVILDTIDRRVDKKLQEPTKTLTHEQSNIRINKPDPNRKQLWKAFMNPNTGLPVMQLIQNNSEYILEFEPYNQVGDKRGEIKFKNKSELQNFINTFNDMIAMPKPGPGEDYDASFSDGSVMFRTDKSKYIGIADSNGNLQELAKRYIEGMQSSI